MTRLNQVITQLNIMCDLLGVFFEGTVNAVDVAECPCIVVEFSADEPTVPSFYVSNVIPSYIGFVVVVVVVCILA